MDDELCTCGARMDRIRTKMELFGGEIVVNDVEAWHCPKCKEDLFTTEQAAMAQDKYRRGFPGFESYSIRKRVAKLGNSLAVPLAKELADYMNLKKGGEVRITVKNKTRLIVDFMPF